MIRENRKLQKLTVVVIVAGMCLGAVSGCNSDAESKEDAVTLKEQNGEQPSTQMSTEEAAVFGNVAEQVQAPEIYQTKVSGGAVTITADAELVIPDVPGIKLKKVTARTFTQEDYDAVNRVLLGGENDLDGFVTVNGQDYWLQIDNNATAVSHRVEFLIGKQGDGDYLPFSNTKPDPENMPESLSDTKFIPGFVNMNTLPEDVMREVTESVNQMGIGEYSVQGGGYYASWIADEYAMSSEEYYNSRYLANMGYGVHLYRVVDGIPIIYTYENGGIITDEDAEKWSQAMENGEDYVSEVVYWPYEEMMLMYNNDGFHTFEWKNPYIIEDMSEEYVFLLPFSDISNIFEEMLLKKQADSFNNEGDTVTIQVDKVVLSYMRIRDKDAKEGILIPVWDFFGTKTFRNAAGEIDLVADNSYDGVMPESLMTINAMDGTIVDRWAGY